MADGTEQAITEETVDQKLDRLLQQDKFDPPQQFRERALLNDPGVYEEANRDPEGWWAKEAEQLHWFKKWDQVLDESNKPFYKWFTGGKINVSYNCLDRHVEAGRGDKVAFHWRGEEGEERDVTYAELLAETQKFANALKDRGVRKGDVVGIWLPMIPEVVVAMLACTRIGAVHNVVFAGFSPGSVKDRMEVSNAKAIITVDGGRRKGRTAPMKATLDEVLDEIPAVESVIVVQMTGAESNMRDGRDYWYHELLEASADECPPEELDAEDPMFILYSSGSTAKPKGILHTTGGFLTGATSTTRWVFDLRPDEDVFWCTADVGWVTGHTYIVYGPMALGATSVMFEGAPDYPHKAIWWELVERLGVTIFYTAPTAIRACMKWGPEFPQKHDLSSLRLLGSVGEPINPKAWAWYHLLVGGERCPIVDTWWQSETGGIMISPLPGITATKPGSATIPLPGIQAAVVDEKGNEVQEGEGLLVIQRPWPAMLRTLYQDDERYVETYFSQFGKDTYFVGDAGRRDEDGYLWVLGRVDDVINVSGHRMSTAEIESAIVSYEKVSEAAVIGKSDPDSGQAVVAFVTLEGEQVDGDEQLQNEIREHVAKKIGKLARPKQLVWASDLPKTRSGKIMRRLLRDIAEGRNYGDVSTLRDPTVMDELQQKLQGNGEAEPSAAVKDTQASTLSGGTAATPS